MEPDKNDGWILVRKDGKTHPVLPGMMFIGKEECDIILQSASADKRHAVLFLDGSNNEIHIKDLNSLTGTYVNGMRIAGQAYVKLKHLDNLRFGYGPDIFYIQNGHEYIPSPVSPSEQSSVQVDEQKVASQSSTVAQEMPITIKRRSQKKSSSSLQAADSLEDLQGKPVVQSANFDGTKNKALGDIGATSECVTFRRRDTCIIDTPSEALLASSVQVNTSSSDKKCDTVPVLINSERNKSSHSDVKMNSTTTSVPLANAGEEEPDLESSPLAMAFTVAFDNPTPRKKFSIRDSISKYAPKKAEAKKQEKTPDEDKSTKKVEKTEAKKEYHIQLRRKKKSTHDTPQTEGKKVNSEEASKPDEPKLSHGATFLIQKMFRSNSNKEPSTTSSTDMSESKRSALYEPPLEIVPNSPKKEECKNKASPTNEDNKSETGTYTIDEEENAKAVKEAREKIDEIFGIAESKMKKVDSPVEPSDNINTTFEAENCTSNEVACERQEVPNTATSPFSDASYGKTIDQNVVAPIRTKRRLPTPPIQSPFENTQSLPERKSHHPHLTYNTYSLRPRPQTVFQNSTQANEVRPDPSAYDKRTSCITKGRTSPNPSLSRSMNNKLTLSNLELLQNLSGSGKLGHMVNGSSEIPTRRTPPSAGARKRNPFHFSGSDMDLDQMKIETSSVLSDVSASTEPPSINPASGRTETAPTMKFNRAFALRRARLGLETDMPVSNKPTPPKDAKPSKEMTRSAPASSLSRQDGGRFSLRLPKSATKPVANKNTTKPSATKTQSSSTTPKFGHRRMDSDPATTALLRRGIDSKMSVPDVRRPKSSIAQPQINRTPSIGSSGHNSPEPTVQQQKSYGWRPEAESYGPSKFSSRYSRGSSSNIASTEGYNKESRPSPVHLDKPELSALDNLVIQATHQLSVKLKTVAHQLLVKERDKFTEDSSERLMIDEVLPRVLETSNPCSACNERGVSQDLANILKNLKRVEQSLEVLAIVDDDRMDQRRHHHHHHMSNNDDNLYVVDI